MLPPETANYYHGRSFPADRPAEEGFHMRKILTLFSLCGFAVPIGAHEYMSFEQLSEAFGYDFETAEVRSEAVGPGLHLLFGVGGNVIVSIGDQGVMMVDSQFSRMMPKLKQTISELGGGEVDLAVNTHWHFDHADGNPVLGRDGAWLVAQSNSRRMMTGKRDVSYVDTTYQQPAFPPEALPVATFSDHMQLHFNGETIDLFHFGPAHTTGDTAVYFRNANVIHMGDVFFPRYPYIDAGNGGDLYGMIRFCEEVLARLNADSIVVPGHGPASGYDDLASYIEMLETMAERLSAMIDRGMTLEEVLAANPSADFDERFGNPLLFITKAYESLSR
jgi:glyoxylase-like metal-dependent hydrolase (beta-lactamase superfamily II)